MILRALGLGIALSLAALPSAARACGGFFCDRPNVPTDLPVAQTGENVLFAMDSVAPGRYRLEAHIQIFYTGPADRFSWVVPVDALPTLDIGSNGVFAALDAATRPRLQVTQKTEGECADPAGRGGVFNGTGGKSAPGATGGADEEHADPGVQVAFKGSVGPFDAVVVKADDPGKLKAWLAENMYYLSDEGSRLIDDYVQEGKYFVALKLQPGKMVNEIRPIVLRFEGPGPCVPLRLTAVASLPDLRVNLWVLSQHRVVPENYFEITINEAKLDWLGNGGNYQELLGAAANEAGGNAFAVEYVGPTTPLAGKLLPDQTTAPDGELQQVTDAYNAGQFPGKTLTEVLEEQVWKPRRAAQQLIDAHPKLTRLVTFISPDEMKVDPTFIENSTLPDVSNLRAASAVLMCGAREYQRCLAPMRIDMPSGKSLYLPAPDQVDGWCGGQQADRKAIDQMPALERGWKREAIGEGALRFDNTAKIDAVLAAQKDAVTGCGCALGGRPRPAPLWLLPALALLLRRRRR